MGIWSVRYSSGVTGSVVRVSMLSVRYGSGVNGSVVRVSMSSEVLQWGNW